MEKKNVICFEKTLFLFFTSYSKYTTNDIFFFLIKIEHLLITSYELVDMMLPLTLTQRDHPTSWDLLRNAQN